MTEKSKRVASKMTEKSKRFKSAMTEKSFCNKSELTKKRKRKNSVSMGKSVLERAKIVEKAARFRRRS